jgi:hypothetical protein
MINPEEVYFFESDVSELEEFILFCVAVAGKNASTQSRLLHKLLYEHMHVDFYKDHGWLITCWLDLPGPRLPNGPVEKDSPFERLRFLEREGLLGQFIRHSKLGQYNKIERSYRELIKSNICLKTCSVEELESIHGIGMKTSRFFLLRTRPNLRLAVLDTHILKYMRNEMGLENIPKSTPSNPKQYARLEKIFCDHCDSLGKTVDDLDLEIWTKYSQLARGEKN